jgi:hypothetical protein
VEEAVRPAADSNQPVAEAGMVAEAERSGFAGRMPEPPP